MPAINWKHFALSAVACLLIISIIIAVTWSTPRIESIEKVEFVNIADSFVNLRMTCRVNNSNFYTISGKKVQVRFSESDKLFGEGSVDTFCFHRAGKSTLAGTIRINFKQVLRSYDQIRADSVEPAVSITGRFMPCFFISKVDFKQKIPKRDILKILFNALRDSHVTAAKLY